MERTEQINLFSEETLLPPVPEPEPVLADDLNEHDAEEEDSGTPAAYTWKKAKGEPRRVFCYRDADGRLQHKPIDKEDRSYDQFHHGTFTDFGYQIVYHPDVLNGWGIAV